MFLLIFRCISLRSPGYPQKHSGQVQDRTVRQRTCPSRLRPLQNSVTRRRHHHRPRPLRLQSRHPPQSMLCQESAPLVAHGPPQAHHYALNAENKQRPIQLHTQSNNSATNSDCLRWTPPVRHYDQCQRASHKMQKLRPR